MGSKKKNNSLWRTFWYINKSMSVPYPANTQRYYNIAYKLWCNVAAMFVNNVIFLRCDDISSTTLMLILSVILKNIFIYFFNCHISLGAFV